MCVRSASSTSLKGLKDRCWQVYRGGRADFVAPHEMPAGERHRIAQ